MMYCNHYCNGFGKHCGFRTQDSYCALSYNVVYTDHTEQTEQTEQTEKEDKRNS